MMNELIPINCENETPTVDERALHAALGVATDYPHWFSRMSEYGFDEGKGYRTILTDRSDGLTGDDRFPSVNSYPITAWEGFVLETSL